MKFKRFYRSLTALFIVFLIIGIFAKEPSSASDLNSSLNGEKETIIQPEVSGSGESQQQGSSGAPDKTLEGDSSKEEIGQPVDTPSENEGAKIHFIDTGNSDSILITIGGKAVLIDGGDNDDESLVANYIKEQGVTRLNYVIATHPDADHIGGLDAVINSVEVENLFVSNRSADTKTYRDFITAAADKGLNPSVPLEESQFQLSDNSYIKFYNTDGGRDNNESSLVTLFVNGNDKFLLMGDAEKETEKQILSKVPDVDVLKVGHHGSKTSTTQDFLDKANPEYAILLVGKNSRYRHPALAVMTKLEDKGIEVHRSDECGHIIFESTGNSVSTECAKGSYTPGDK